MYMTTTHDLQPELQGHHPKFLESRRGRLLSITGLRHRLSKEKTLHKHVTPGWREKILMESKVPCLWKGLNTDLKIQRLMCLPQDNLHTQTSYGKCIQKLCMYLSITLAMYGKWSSILCSCSSSERLSFSNFPVANNSSFTEREMKPLGTQLYCLAVMNNILSLFPISASSRTKQP